MAQFVLRRAVNDFGRPAYENKDRSHPRIVSTCVYGPLPCRFHRTAQVQPVYSHKKWEAGFALGREVQMDQAESNH